MNQNGQYRTIHARRGWRQWLLLFALAWTVALYSVETTHEHRTVADELRCPVCHVVGHNALDSSTPELKPALLPALLSFLLLSVFAAVLPRRNVFLSPPSRAPPAR